MSRTTADRETGHREMVDGGRGRDRNDREGGGGAFRKTRHREGTDEERERERLID